MVFHFSNCNCPHLSLTKEPHRPITASTQLSMASYFTLNTCSVHTSRDTAHDSPHNLFIGHPFILDLLTLTAGFIHFVVKWWNTFDCEMLQLDVCYRLRPVPISGHHLIPFIRIATSVWFSRKQHTLWQYSAAYNPFSRFRGLSPQVYKYLYWYMLAKCSNCTKPHLTMTEEKEPWGCLCFTTILHFTCVWFVLSFFFLTPSCSIYEWMAPQPRCRHTILRLLIDAGTTQVPAMCCLLVLLERSDGANGETWGSDKSAPVGKTSSIERGC